MKLTATILIKMGVHETVANLYITPFLTLQDQYEINTPLRIAHFFAQLIHETSGLRITSENLNYSEAGLLTVFKKYFAKDQETATLQKKYLASAFARKPESIANVVYANRMGNGSVKSGDGWKYRGRGVLMNTGKSQYHDLSIAFGTDYMNNPDLLSRPYDGLRAAMRFWQLKGLNKFADADNILAITKAINGGFNGLQDRQHCLALAKKALGL